jgi:hypothetical protein
MSLAYDALVVVDVFDRPHDDWIPVTYALLLLLPAGLILLYLGQRVARVSGSRRKRT